MRTATRSGPGERGARVAMGSMLLALVLALAGCGSSDDGDEVASADSPSAKASPSGSAKADADPDDALAQSLKYAQCMRESGVPQFPDPVQKNNGGLDISLPDGVDRQAVEAAEKLCKQFLPKGGENKPIDPEIAKRNRDIAKCMRENGVPNFPDPGPDGGLQIQNEPGSGLDPSNPAFDAASKKCNMTGPAGEGAVNDVKTP
ncbi:hypothetical protein OG216_03565 [Streptomycetaceae bacterium NBC_01309]